MISRLNITTQIGNFRLGYEWSSGSCTRYPPILHNGSHLILNADKAEVFAEFLEAQCSPNLSQPPFLAEHRNISETIPFPSLNIQRTSPNEISEFIRCLKNRKSPEPDSIPNHALKLFPLIHNIMSGTCLRTQHQMRVH